MTYESLHDPHLAKMVISLPTPDYRDLPPQTLQSLDQAHASNAHSIGWAGHAYDDSGNFPD